MHILIARNNSNSAAMEASVLLQAYSAQQGIACSSLDSYDLPQASREGIDMVVVLGGDGTILRAADFVAEAGIPILGINYGNLGFLANDSSQGAIDVLASALAGDVVREERANLHIDVMCEGDDEEAFEHVLAGDDPLPGRSFFALNEAAITRGASGRIIDFALDIGGQHLADMRGDGLVVASATGSTAYALSAGGPLVAPGFTGLIVVPLAPHTIKSRAVVTGPGDVVEARMVDTAATREATLFVDGVPARLEAPLRRLCVRRGQVPTVLLRCDADGFYAHASDVFF